MSASVLALLLSRLGLVSTSAALTVLLHLAFSSLLHALPFQARITTHPIVSGAISIAPPSSTIAEVDKPFHLIPENLRLTRLELDSADGLEYHWVKGKSDAIVSLDVYAVSGCFTNEGEIDVLDEDAVYSATNINDIQITSDLKRQHLVIDGEQTQLRILDATILPFWLNKGPDEAFTDITQFLDSSSDVRANTSQNVSVIITGALLETDEEGGAKFVERRFSIIVDGEEEVIIFEPLKYYSPNTPIRCEILSGGLPSQEGVRFSEQAVAGILVRVERVDVPDDARSNFDGMYNLSGVSGWLKVPSVDIGKLARLHLGKLNFVELSGSLAEFSIDGDPQHVTSSQRFSGFGDLTARYLNDGGLSILGEYRAGWIDTKRLNRTKWEALQAELRVPLLGALLGVLYWLSQRAFRLWQRNERIGW